MTSICLGGGRSAAFWDQCRASAGAQSARVLMNRSVSSDRVSAKAAPRSRGFMVDDRAKYPSYVQIVLGLVVLGVIFALPSLSTFLLTESQTEGAKTPQQYLRTEREVILPRYQLKIIADLDQQSRVQDAKKPTWISTLMDVQLDIDPVTKAWSVMFGEQRELLTGHNEAGRGMELSELVLFNGNLYTMDDRTGIVFEITKDYKAVPRHIIMEGDGNSIKGQKIEWATVKNGELYVGSIGKEYTLADGSIASVGGFWVATIDANGKVTYLDWTKNYNSLRKATGTLHPGYLLHEAIMWSPHQKRWVILPRRVSTDPYDEDLDNTRGSNYVLIATEDFSHVQYLRIGDVTPIRGFSSFKFLPGSKDTIIVALKSEEHPDTGHQSAYITAFSIEGEGKLLLPETEVPGARKYEGLEFM